MLQDNFMETFYRRVLAGTTTASAEGSGASGGDAVHVPDFWQLFYLLLFLGSVWSSGARPFRR